MEIANYLVKMWDLALQGEGQGIFFWAALYAFVVLLYSFIYQIRVAGWPATEGELITVGVRKFGGSSEWAKSDQEYVASALYNYVVAGKAYQRKSVSPWVLVATHNMQYFLAKQLKSVQKLPGGKVRVFYNPHKPRKSFLIKPGIKGQLVTVALAVTPFILYYSKYAL